MTDDLGPAHDPHDDSHADSHADLLDTSATRLGRRGVVAGGGVLLTGAMLQATPWGRQVLEALGHGETFPVAAAGKPFPHGVRVEQVRRPEDLMVVDLVLVNLATRTSGGRLYLEVADQKKRAFLAVVLPGQNLGETASRSTGRPRSIGRLALPSVLAFQLPRTWRAPYDLPRLLTWTGFAPAWTVRGTDPVSRIEAPYRLLLRPDPLTVWQHAVEPVKHTGTTEVWHTRLTARPSSKAKPDQRASRYRTVRVTRALKTSVGFPLTNGHRAAIVSKSKVTPVSADRLILSALGSTLELHGRWPDTTGLLSWDHRATLGRDQYVKTVESGFLAPWGHRAAKVTETWRTMTDFDGEAVAVLQSFETIVLLDQVVDTSLVKVRTGSTKVAGCALPFQKVRSTVAVTGRLDTIVAGTVPTLYGTQTALTLPFVGTDWAGREVPFTSRVLWIDSSLKGNTAWNALSGSARTVDLLGQRTAVAPGTNGSTTLPVTQLVVRTQTLSKAQVDKVDPKRARLRPVTETIRVQLPGLSALAAPGTDPGGVTHTYHASYVSNEANAGGIVLGLAETGGGARRRAVDGVLPPSRTGGMLSPPSYQGFSSKGGALMAESASALNLAATGRLDPAAVFGDITLLGGIPLSKIVPGITEATKVLPAGLPQVRHETVDGRQSVRLTVSPPLQKASIEVAPGVELRFVPGKLTIDVVVRTGGTGPAEETFEARLTDAGLQLAGVVVLPIEELRLASSSGNPLDVTFRAGDVSFLGPLAFVQQLAKLVATLLGESGANRTSTSTASRTAPVGRAIALPGPQKRGLEPDVDVSPSGIHLGLGLALPDVAVGAFTLSGLGFGLGVEIPFTNPSLVVDLAFATHDSPFVVTYGPFGGGGYVALRLRGGEIDNLEVCLLIAGGIGVNLGVAAGAISVQAGFVLALPAGKPVAVTAFFRASGSLEVLGLVSLSVVFEIALKFVDTSPSTLTGTATLQLKVKVLCCSKTVKASVSRTFAGGQQGQQIGSAPTPTPRPVIGERTTKVTAPPDERFGFRDTYPTITPWNTYVSAFAPTPEMRGATR